MRTPKQEIIEFNRWLKHEKASMDSEEEFLYRPPNLPLDYFKTLNTMTLNEHRQNKLFQLEWFTEEEVKSLLDDVKDLPFTTRGIDTYDLDTPRIYFDDEENTEIFFRLYRKFFAELSHIVELLLGMEVKDINSIFIANYSPEEFPIDSCHTDDASDVSIVVAMNDDYEGGGFELYGGGYYGRRTELPKPPIGSATIFPGKEKFHRSKTTTKGSRLILVFWCSAYDIDEVVPIVPLENFTLAKVEEANKLMAEANEFVVRKRQLRI